MHEIDYKDWKEIYQQIERLRKARRNRIILCFVSFSLMLIFPVLFQYSKIACACLLFICVSVSVSGIKSLFLKCPNCNNSFHSNFTYVEGQILQVYSFKIRQYSMFGQFSKRCIHCGFPLTDEELKIVS